MALSHKDSTLDFYGDLFFRWRIGQFVHFLFLVFLAEILEHPLHLLLLLQLALHHFGFSLLETFRAIISLFAGQVVQLFSIGNRHRSFELILGRPGFNFFGTAVIF